MNFDSKKASRPLMFKSEGGRAVKKRRKSILMPRLLRFTFRFLLFVAQLAPSLPFSFAALSRPGTARFRPPILPTARTFHFCVSFLPLSRCIKIEFPELKAPPFTFEHKRSRSLFRKSKFIALICYFSREGFWLRFGMGGGAG